MITAVIVGGVVLAACSSGSSSPTTTTSGSHTSTTRSPSTPSTSAPITSAPSSTTTATSATGSTTAAGLSACTAAGLSGAIVGSTGAAGTEEITVSLRNTGTAPCTLGGYPGLLLLAASGASLPTTVVRKGAYSFTAMAPTTVTVAPGTAVYFNIGYSDVPVGSETSCPTSASLEITPPNDVDHLEVPATLSACGGGTLTVSPVFQDSGTNTQTTAPPSG